MKKKSVRYKATVCQAVFSDKILIICEVLDVTPYELLSGAEHTGNRSRDNNTYVISEETEIGILVETYQKVNTDAQKRVMGYMKALTGEHPFL